jgi:O-antigen ligase
MMRKLALFTALVLIFTIPWETAITVSTLGTLTRLIGFGAAGVWAASVLITGKLRVFHGYYIGVLVFILFNVASIFWTASIDLTMERIKTYLQLAVLTWLLWDLFTTPRSLRLAMQIFIFGAYLAIASQFANLLSGQIISTYEQGRYTGAGQNANEFSLILSLSLPLAWHLAITQKPGTGAVLLKVVNFTFVPLALLATILTASRTSLVTVIPSLLYIVATLNKIKPVYRALAVVLVIIIFAIIEPLIPQTTIARLMTIGDSIAGNDLGGRVRLWKGSFAIFLDHPFLGIGSNALSAPGQLGSYAHNTFLSIMAELGLIGLLLFLGVLSIVIDEAIRQPKPYSALWITIIAVWLIGVFTLTWEYTKPTWFFLTLIVISAGINNYRDNPQQISSVSVPSSIDSDFSVMQLGVDLPK